MIDKDEVIIIDDAISPQFQDVLEAKLTGGDCGWYFSKDVAFPDEQIEKFGLASRFAFSKTYLDPVKGIRNEMFDTILPLLFEACHKVNFHLDQAIFSRSFFTMPVPGDGPNSHDHIHVDTIEPHMVCLYYVNDSDGDTILFDHTLDEFLQDPTIADEISNIDYSRPHGGPLEIIDKHIDRSTFKEWKRITPKKGRMVFFNGWRYHSSQRSTKDYRIVINSCVKGHFNK
jgi:hypothetical protein